MSTILEELSRRELAERFTELLKKHRAFTAWKSAQKDARIVFATTKPYSWFNAFVWGTVKLGRAGGRTEYYRRWTTVYTEWNRMLNAKI